MLHETRGERQGERHEIREGRQTEYNRKGNTRGRDKQEARHYNTRQDIVQIGSGSTRAEQQYKRIETRDRGESRQFKREDEKREGTTQEARQP